MKRIVFAIVLFFFISGSATAQTMWKYFSPGDFEARRQKLMEQIGDGIAVLQGAELNEAYIKFRQDNNFYYLSGVEVPDAAMIIDGKNKKAYLFVPEETPNDIKAEAIIKPGDSSARVYKFNRVLPKSRLGDFLRYLSGSGNPFYIMTTPEETIEMSRDRCEMIRIRRQNDPWDSRVPKEMVFLKKMQERFPLASFKNLSPLLDAMRAVKDDKEIAVLRECGRIGCLGIDEAIKVTRPGIYEYQTVAACDFIYADMGSSFPAYYPIAASGERGLIWHYNANNHLLEPGTVLLIDYAPELNYYVTDITRTWPVSGKFTADQLKMYNCLKEARDAMIAAMKPGITIKGLAEIGKAIYTKHGMQKYWLDYVGHFVGMSVHDVGNYDAPFVKGVVFNVEPIIEDKEKKIHFRLEDTIVITATGAENLTPQSPVEVEAIYKMIQQKGVGEK